MSYGIPVLLLAKERTSIPNVISHTHTTAKFNIASSSITTFDTTVIVFFFFFFLLGGRVFPYQLLISWLLQHGQSAAIMNLEIYS